MATDTIYALSSGAPPAAIAVIRISGPDAGAALSALAGVLPESRRARLRTLRDRDGEVLDTALVLWLPGPATATGEDMVELHCHGGRAIVAAMEAALALLPGMRLAEPGEFTRRAFGNGRIDLAEAEGLADLLTAETELQRRNAMSLAAGELSRRTAAWRDELLAISSVVEAELDFGDEDGTISGPLAWHGRAERLASELQAWLARPPAELLRDGVRVVLAGPPNVGKSSLFNALVSAEAAIVTPVAGTTRDVLTRSVALTGVPFVFVDTAGVREWTDDPVEEIGIIRARDAAADADIVLWLGSEGAGPTQCWEIEARVDDPARECKRHPRHRVSVLTGEGVTAFIEDLVDAARTLLPKPGQLALNERQRRLLLRARESIGMVRRRTDLLLVGEDLRQGRLAFDLLLGRTGTEDMLDTLFGRFCIGK